MDTTPAYPLSFNDDVVQPFQLDESHLRGRLVRLGPSLDEILNRHAYPEPVASILGETLTLAVTLAGMLKYDGIFTLQTKGDGPVSLMVVDVTSTGDLRGYAQFDTEQLETLADTERTVPDLLGKGYLAFTVDQGENTDRYQGIVELTGHTMSDCVQHYFRQSEQLDTGITVAIGRRTGENQAEGWRAGALMVQRMPPDDAGRVMQPATNEEDDWRHAMVLMGTCTPDEMLDPALPPNDLLYRLFHEGGVRVYAPHPVRPGCRCSRERVSNVLRTIPDEDIAYMTVDGLVSVTCEFCNTTYSFDEKQIAELQSETKGAGPLQ